MAIAKNETLFNETQFETKPLFLAGILDKDNFDWADIIFNVTIELLNNASNGWHDEDVSGVEFEYRIEDSACDASQALAAYWKLRPMHGIIGARCSGASIQLARMGTVENVPQISMSSSSAKL